MYRIHALFAVLLLVLLVLHLAAAAVTLLTAAFFAQEMLRCFFFAVVCMHGLLALWRVLRGKGLRELMAYPGKNKTYWLRVGSGIAVFLLLLIHRTLWTEQTGFGLLPKNFTQGSLVVQMLFLIVLATHIMSNIRPLLLDFGVDSVRRRHILQGFFALCLAFSGLCVGAYYWGVVL